MELAAWRLEQHAHMAAYLLKPSDSTFPTLRLTSDTDITFGRGDNVTQKFDTKKLSRMHCRIELQIDGGVSASNLSHNSIFVDGKQIKDSTSVPLAAGSVLGFHGNAGVPRATRSTSRRRRSRRSFVASLAALPPISST